MSKIAVLGYGVVGSGVLELFYKNKNGIDKKSGAELDVKYILDIRDFPGSPYENKFVKDISVILNDNDVIAVAECMGGLSPAFEYVKACLERGKSVCTSNKELVAAKGAELLAIAKKNKCNFFFEASVGGAIPIVRPLHRCLAANEITSIAGILNGTTNFILTKMINEKLSFDDALKLAQNLGYAERDPSDDIEGKDACRKICILASLAFGKHVYPESVYTKGIKDVTLADMEAAKHSGYAVKLIAYAEKTGDGKLMISVRPCFVGYDSLISRVDDVFNAIMVTGDGIDRVMFYGRGAGKMPTASAVISDIIEAVKHNRTVFSQYWEDSADAGFILEYPESRSRMYFRTDGKNDGITGGIEYIVYKEGADAAFITKKITMREADEIKNKLEQSGVTVHSMFPVLD